MNYSLRSEVSFLAGMMAALVTVAAVAALPRGLALAKGQQPAADSTGVNGLLEDFRHVEVASVSDAAEQILGRKIYMSHRMQAVFPAKFAGFAVTVHLKRMKATKIRMRWRE